MAILIDQHTTVVVQGITGKEGQKITRAMLDYGTNVVGGVRPGKGGERIEGVPVFNTLAEMVAQHQHVDTSVVVVPPQRQKWQLWRRSTQTFPSSTCSWSVCLFRTLRIA